MLSLVAGLLAMQVPVGQPPRLRTLLSNRATVLVERVPNAPTLSVQLFVSARGTIETPTTNGRRHLLEHLLARGTTGDLDMRLETAGGYLNAHTTRDAMQFQVSLPAGKLKLGLEALQETMHMPPITAQAIRHETQIIAQEGALRTATDKLAAAAWAAAYGDQGLDAFGNLDVQRTTTPTELSELHRKMFVGSNLVISIAGDVDLDAATKQAADMLRVIPMGNLAEDAPRPPASFSDVSLPGLGDARGAPAPGLLSPRLAWTLAAGLAVAAGLEDSFVTYTPTMRNGLVIVGQTGGGGLGKAFEAADAKQLVTLGRRLARAWVERQLEDPESIASFRGMLLVQDAGLRPDTLLENLATMNVYNFEEGLDAFRVAPSTQPAPAAANSGSMEESNGVAARRRLAATPTPPSPAGAGDQSQLAGVVQGGRYAQAAAANRRGVGEADRTSEFVLAAERRPEPSTTRRQIQLPVQRARFIELADPGFDEVEAVAVVKLPPLDSHERSMLGQLIATMPYGPAEYARRDLMAMTGGRLIRCELMDDCLTIEIPAFKENLAAAVVVLAEMLQTPHPADPNQPTTSAEPPDPWESILHGPFTRPDGLKPRPGELDDFFHQIFRPDKVSVAVSGPFNPGEAQSLWERKTQDWRPPKYPHAWPPADPLPAGSPVIGELELDGPEISAGARDLPTSLLAMFALGSGKGAGLFRLAREEDGLSYRQEAILWPTQGGFLPRLVVASAGLKDGEVVGAELKKQLLNDVAAWTEADRQRAAGLAEGVLLRGVPLSPFYFQPDGPVDGSIGDAAFLEAYWIAKTGEPWNPSALAVKLYDVSLDALKAEAARLLTASTIRVQNP